jgi:hypothetical protein
MDGRHATNPSSRSNACPQCRGAGAPSLEPRASAQEPSLVARVSQGARVPLRSAVQRLQTLTETVGNFIENRTRQQGAAVVHICQAQIIMCAFFLVATTNTVITMDIKRTDNCPLTGGPWSVSAPTMTGQSWPKHRSNWLETTWPEWPKKKHHKFPMSRDTQFYNVKSIMASVNKNASPATTQAHPFFSLLMLSMTKYTR